MGRSKISSRHFYAASILLREHDRSSSDSIVLLDQEDVNPEVFRRRSEKDNKKNSSSAGGIGGGSRRGGIGWEDRRKRTEGDCHKGHVQFSFRRGLYYCDPSEKGLVRTSILRSWYRMTKQRH